MNELLYLVLKETGAGVPAEFQVLPEGKIEINGAPPAYLDEGAARKVIAFFKARGNDMVIDYEHQTLKDGQAPAAGWIKDLAWKGKDGLWAVVEWTKKAKDYLENREYRYFSPVIYVSAPERLVTSLVSVALTNLPAINNLIPIITKMDLNGGGDIVVDACQRRVNELMGISDEAFMMANKDGSVADPSIDETQRNANQLMGIDDATFRKYNK